MRKTTSTQNRRTFLKLSGGITAASTLAGIAVPAVHAAESMACRGRTADMTAAGTTCAETEILLHALLDGELDAGHARDVERALPNSFTRDFR